ncbi:MAG: hypothetical protein IJS96_10945 [Schwartzia sp.]|nr:hypothetical protein [Schwartzia sp. (in: firmicutes)]
MIEEKFDDLVKDLMQNPRFREEYDAMKPEFEAVRAEMETPKEGRSDVAIVHARKAIPRAVPATQ